MTSDSEPVLLVRVYDPVEAEIIEAKLRSAGIESFSRHDALSVVYGLTIDGLGRRDLYVRAEDLEEARAALQTEDDLDEEALDGADLDAPGGDADTRDGGE